MTTLSRPSSEIADDPRLSAPVDADMPRIVDSSDAVPPPASVPKTISADVHANAAMSAAPAKPAPNSRRVRFVEEPTWEIFVRMPRGYIISLKVHPSNLAKDVRSMISAKVGVENLEEQCIPDEFQRLLYNFRRLDDDKTLAQNRISGNCTLDMFGRTLGQL